MEESTPVWKKIYQIVSGKNKHINPDIVDEMLKLSKDKIVNTLLDYKCYTRESFDVWVKDAKYFSNPDDDDMRNLVHRFGKELDLEVSSAWSVLSNFLMFEYYGKEDELKSIVRFESNIISLIDNIWHFYSADRMFMLKTLRHVFEKLPDTKYMYHKQFDKFIKSIDVKQMYKNLMQLYERLLSEMSTKKIEPFRMHPKRVEEWAQRNNCEQLEVLTLIIHTLHHISLDGNELKTMLRLFIKNGFGGQPLVSDWTRYAQPEIIERIKCAGVGTILVIAKYYFEHPDVCKSFPEKDRTSLTVAHSVSDCGIVVLTWTLLKLNLTEDGFELCNDVIVDLCESKVFLQLLKILQNDIFENTVCGEIVFGGAFTLMKKFSESCSGSKYAYEQDSVTQIVATLMRCADLNAHVGLKDIFDMAVETFPFDYKSLTGMLCSMVQSEATYPVALDKMENLTTFLAHLPWQWPHGPYELLMDKSTALFQDSQLFNLPEKTRIQRYQMGDEDFCLVHHKYTFFNTLEQFMSSLKTVAHQGNLESALVNDIVEGYKLILAILKNYKGTYLLNPDLKRCVDQLKYVPGHFSDGPLRSFELIKLYFEVQKTLLVEKHLNLEEAFTPMLQVWFLPQLSDINSTFKRLFLLETHIDSILHRCLKEEEAKDDHSLLISYLELLLFMATEEVYHKEVQQPGLAYLTSSVFPHYCQWNYQNKHQMVVIGKGCFTLYVKLMQKDYASLDEESKSTYMKYLETFLDEDWFMTSFIANFAKVKYCLEAIMEAEPDWINGKYLDHFESIRMQLLLLLLMLKLRKEHFADKSMLFDGRISFFAKGVSAFMVNSYSTSITILSLTFLEVLSRDMSVPVMALLSLDYDQAQRIFLDRLRDSMECDEVKMHILKLISTCVRHQHGLTAAFFNVNCSKKWYDIDKRNFQGDTVSDFMVDYLQNIRKSRDYLKHPLQIGILEVMSNLWLTDKQQLIKDVMDLDAFWPLLLDPLFQEFDQSPEIYAHLLKILVLQMYSNSADPKLFTSTVGKFYKDVEQFKKFMTYLVGIFEIPISNPLVKIKDLLQNFTELMVISAEVYPDFLSDLKLRWMLVEMALKGLQNLDYSTDSNLVGYWVDLIFLLVCEFGVDRFNPSKLASRYLDALFNIKLLYSPTSINSRVRDAILCTFFRVLTGLKAYYETHSCELLELLEVLGCFFDVEYHNIKDNMSDVLIGDPWKTKNYIHPWTTCMYIANVLLQMQNAGDVKVWFSYRYYLTRLIESIPLLLNCPATLLVVKIAFYSMMLYVESPLAFDFANLNLVQFFDTIEPSLYAMVTDINQKTHPRKLQEVWSVITLLMKLNQALVRKFQHTSMRPALAFLSLNDNLINYIFSLPLATVDLAALDLVAQTIILYDCILLNWNEQFYIDGKSVYYSGVTGIKQIVNACISLIIRPTNITFYEIDRLERCVSLDNTVASEDVAVVMNRLINIVGLSFGCLYKINPDLVTLLGVYMPTDTFYVLVQDDFSVPNFNEPALEDLTYGRILCLADFLCKISNQLHHQKTSLLAKDQSTEFIGFVEYQPSTAESFATHKLTTTFLRYGMYKYELDSNDPCLRFDPRIVRNALEMLFFFLGSQAYLMLRKMTGKARPYFKRNMTADLHFFYDFVKKRTAESMPAKVELFRSDIDMVKKFMMACKQNGTFDSLADEHFLIFISQWFTNACMLR